MQLLWRILFRSKVERKITVSLPYIAVMFSNSRARIFSLKYLIISMLYNWYNFDATWYR